MYLLHFFFFFSTFSLSFIKCGKHAALSNVVFLHCRCLLFRFVCSRKLVARHTWLTFSAFLPFTVNSKAGRNIKTRLKHLSVAGAVLRRGAKSSLVIHNLVIFKPFSPSSGLPRKLLLYTLWLVFCVKASRMEI